MADEHNKRLQGKPMQLGPAPQLDLPSDPDTNRLYVMGLGAGLATYLITKKTDSAVGFGLLAALISKYYFMRPTYVVPPVKQEDLPTPNIFRLGPPLLIDRSPGMHYGPANVHFE